MPDAEGKAPAEQVRESDVSEPHMPDADEEGFFEIYWALRKENSWKRSLLPSEAGKPCPKEWGDGFKHAAREAWMARASLHVQRRSQSQEGCR